MAGVLLAVILLFRWGGALLTGYLSHFRWLRPEALEYAGIWHYGLPLVDPRFASALLWALIYAAFLYLILIPAAAFLARRLPSGGMPRGAAICALALGLGTRGLAGPLLLRSVLATPPGVSEGPEPSILAGAAGARAAVAVSDAWWLLPLLVVLFHLLPALASAAARPRWLPVVLAWSLLQPGESAYLLTAGGPVGATTCLSLLAFNESFGKQEFGYGAVLTVLMLPAALLLVWSLLRLKAGASPEHACPETVAGATWPWLLAPCAMGAPFLLAAGFGRLSSAPEPPGGAPVLWSLLLTAGAVLWTVPVVRLLDPLPARSPARLSALAALGLPVLAWVIPLTRLSWERGAGLAGFTLFGGLLGAAPALAWAWPAAAYGRSWEQPLRWSACAWVAAWAAWTEGLLPIMLTREMEALRPLPAAMAWEIATTLPPSVLAISGWPELWLGGTILAAGALSVLMAAGRKAPGGGND